MTTNTEPQWLQQGIEGLAEDKPLTSDDDSPVLRKRLYDYITSVFYTTKLGFARLIGVSPATVSKWLHTTTMPSTYLLLKISRETGFDLQEVMELFEEGL
ncbi:MAG: helix-turn-helix transcriptional regulator [Corallococcus sp.]|nr:helix-turn-helix transcriptional regulator [Corallococcus sp.]MCM1359093.1 helix-turn-helix transcriptional regulator [Corallococcus sp.]MCM1395082.1 helix-turn-helix transcriptional regulator [Corallococcus sp.]